MEFPACDVHGREYAKLSELKPGDRLEIDGGFPCIHRGRKRTVRRDEGGLFVGCLSGQHYLDGQADDGEHLVGMYPVRG
jgi:hypothetical protein